MDIREKGKYQYSSGFFREFFHGFTGLVLLVAGLSVHAAIPTAERDALITLYDATSGDSWAKGGPGWPTEEGKTSWRDAGDFAVAGTECGWYGVTCNAEGATVIDLRLDENGLNGPITAAIGAVSDLPNLNSLNLGTNTLSGVLPAALNELTQIQNVALANNELTGQIPAIGALTELTHLSLNGNQLTEFAAPASLASLEKLEWLWLHKNNIDAPIPTEIGGLENLVELRLNKNQFYGEIPAGLGSLSVLEILELSDNLLTGNIPVELGSLAALKLLAIPRNQLEGSIPAELSGLSSLEELHVAGNKLSGEVASGLLTVMNGMLDGKSDFRFNALFTEDVAFGTVLEQKQGPGESWFTGSQTGIPQNFRMTAFDKVSATLAWDHDPIGNSLPGRYRIAIFDGSNPLQPEIIERSEAPGNRKTVIGLDQNKRYEFRIQAETDPHGGNANTVTSDFSNTVTAADPSESTLIVDKTTAEPDGQDKIKATVQAYDIAGNPIAFGGETVVISASGGASVSSVTDNGDGTYSSFITSNTTGLSTVQATLNGDSLDSSRNVQFSSSPAVADPSKSKLTVNKTEAIADGKDSIIATVQAYDTNGDKLLIGGDQVVISASNGASVTPVTDNGDGSYSATISSNTSGISLIQPTLNGTPVSATDVTFNAVENPKGSSGGGSIGLLWLISMCYTGLLFFRRY